MLIGVTGSTSAIGKAVVQEAASRGLSTCALVRNPTGPSDRAYDLQTKATESLLDGLDCLIHLAWNWEERIPGGKTNEEAGIELSELCAKLGIRPVLLSTMSAFSGSESAYGSAKCGVEDAFAAASGVSLRAGLIWGGADTSGIVSTLVRLASLRYVCPHLVPDPQLYHSERQTLARLLVDSAIKQSSDPQTYIAASEQSISLSAITHCINGSRRHIHLPISVRALTMGIRLTAICRLPLPIRADSLGGIGAQLESAIQASKLPWLKGFPGTQEFANWLRQVGTVDLDSNRTEV